MRIGAVSYLNTKPLVHGLAEFAPRAEVVFDLPSRLADELAAGKLDVALIPSVEYFQNPDYTIISDACIGCRGPVLSVKLLSRVPMDKIRTLAMDEGSRTSVALVRILLKERYGLSPRLLPFPLGVAAEKVDSDAVLMIGDRAMHPPSGFSQQWDLGDEWCRWAELPFVFAMWVARRESLSELGEIEMALSRARDAGVAQLEEIAMRESASVGLTDEQCLSYLRDNLYFFLGPSEQRGLQLFRQHAMRLGLAPVVPACRTGIRLAPLTRDAKVELS
ncbi:MAG: menaquinone biosynthesis protein [Pirellulaceae bacterium]|nr:menaquinone biosynthesis protein [Pirellulaceae bacterium]